jgi:hypothetical protein
MKTDNLPHWPQSHFCHRHDPPVRFKDCDVVVRLDEKGNPNAKGKFTKSVCSLKKRHPKHMHCSASNCTNVINSTHPAYHKEWKQKYDKDGTATDKRMIQDLLTAKKAQEKREE